MREATRDPSVRVRATDGTADWLLCWQRLLDGYRVVIFDNAAHLRALRAEPSTKVVFHDDETAVLDRVRR